MYDDDPDDFTCIDFKKRSYDEDELEALDSLQLAVLYFSRLDKETGMATKMIAESIWRGRRRDSELEGKAGETGRTGMHNIDLSFPLDDMQALSARQLAVVHLHQEVVAMPPMNAKIVNMSAELVWLQRMEEVKRPRAARATPDPMSALKTAYPVVKAEPVDPCLPPEPAPVQPEASTSAVAGVAGGDGDDYRPPNDEPFDMEARVPLPRRRIPSPRRRSPPSRSGWQSEARSNRDRIPSNREHTRPLCSRTPTTVRRSLSPRRRTDGRAPRPRSVTSPAPRTAVASTSALPHPLPGRTAVSERGPTDLQAQMEARRAALAALETGVPMRQPVAPKAVSPALSPTVQPPSKAWGREPTIERNQPPPLVSPGSIAAPTGSSSSSSEPITPALSAGKDDTFISTAVLLKLHCLFIGNIAYDTAFGVVIDFLTKRGAPSPAIIHYRPLATLDTDFPAAGRGTNVALTWFSTSEEREAARRAHDSRCVSAHVALRAFVRPIDDPQLVKRIQVIWGNVLPGALGTLRELNLRQELMEQREAKARLMSEATRLDLTGDEPPPLLSAAIAALPPSEPIIPPAPVPSPPVPRPVAQSSAPAATAFPSCPVTLSFLSHRSSNNVLPYKTTSAPTPIIPSIPRLNTLTPRPPLPAKKALPSSSATVQQPSSALKSPLALANRITHPKDGSVKYSGKTPTALKTMVPAPVASTSTATPPSLASRLGVGANHQSSRDSFANRLSGGKGKRRREDESPGFELIVPTAPSLTKRLGQMKKPRAPLQQTVEATVIGGSQTEEPALLKRMGDGVGGGEPPTLAERVEKRVRLEE